MLYKIGTEGLFISEVSRMRCLSSAQSEESKLATHVRQYSVLEYKECSYSIVCRLHNLRLLGL